MHTTYAPNFIQPKPACTNTRRYIAPIALAAIVFQLVLPGFASAKTPSPASVHKTPKKQSVALNSAKKTLAKKNSANTSANDQLAVVNTAKTASFSLEGKIKAPSVITAGAEFITTIAWDVAGNKPAENADLVLKIPKTYKILNIAPNALSKSDNVVRWSLGTLVPELSTKKNTAKLLIKVPADARAGSEMSLIGQLCAGPSDARKCAKLTAKSSIQHMPTTSGQEMAVISKETPTDTRPDVSVKDEPLLKIEKQANQRTAQPGNTVIYTIVVKNNGTAVAKNVLVEDTLKNGFVYLENGQVTRTSIIGTLPPASSKTLTYKVVVGTTVKPGQYVNTATASASNHPAVSDSAKIEVIALANIAAEKKPDVSLIKTVNRTSVMSGGILAYKLTVRNNGQASAFNVKVTDQLPLNFSYIDRAGSSATWYLGDLLPNHERIINYDVRVATEAGAGKAINTSKLIGDNIPARSAQASVVVQRGQVLGTLASTGPNVLDFSLIAFALLSITGGYVLLRRSPVRLLTFRR